ncbi:MAG: hypothetical protein A2562_00125 [Candidatus Nealsonbacteria bacterium RIFOXYD1_FULL_39_11]|nr:MAG: hypothetical protein A2562_00125 [Candidatus Nealsonbacteria bacterium RIFOXYD1_FULL_39_11]
MGAVTVQGIRGSLSGITVEFQNGFYETEDEKIIEMLKNHPQYGVKFYSKIGVDVPNKIGLRQENELKVLAEEIRSTCPKCGKKFKNEFGLLAHMRKHKNE